MIPDLDILEQRIEQCISARSLKIKEQLGFGYDGVVYSTQQNTAIKALRYEKLYRNELNVYLRLQSQGIISVQGAKVPRLINRDDELWIVEMSVVSPPFVLDFAGAYLDKAPDWPDEVLLGWQHEKEDQFGADWDRVRLIMATRSRYGIHLADVKPGNITL